MTFFIVTIEEYRGYDCDGHHVPYIVAAHDKEEALSLFQEEIRDDLLVSCEPLALPDLSRKRKPFIVNL